jgi:colanic acid biosynthesis glycosyl transferase WcaI
MGLHILLLRVFWRKTKFVYHIQDLQIDAALELGMIKQPWLKNLLLKTEHLILERSSMVSTISEGMRTKILAKSDQLQDVYIMPNWVDDQVICSADANLLIISELGIPLDKKIFFYSGSIGEKQGLEVLLPIAKALEASCPDLLFVISGTGPYKEHLQAEVAKNKITTILFIDLQPTQIFNHLLNYVHCHLIIQKKQAADLLLPSKLTNILAVGGLSIITAERNTSLFDIAQKNTLGLVIEPENAFSLQESIVQVYSNLTPENASVMLQDIKHNAKVYAAKHLNKKAIIDAFLKSVETLTLN